MKNTTEHEFIKDIGHGTEGTLELAKNNSNGLELREMFEDYANNYSRIYDLLLKNEGSTLIRRFINENEQIIQEVTKQIQSDLLKEVLKCTEKADFTDGVFTDESISIEKVKKLAEEKGLKHY